MLKRVLIAVAVLSIAGCGGGSSSSTPTPPEPGDPIIGGDGKVWLGTNNFGSSVFIIDEDLELFGYSSNSAGLYETVFGNVNGGVPMDLFQHRDSENSSLGSGFTVEGDAQAGVTLSLTEANDGQSLVNTGGPGAYSLTLADSNDMPALTLASVAGTWQSQVGLCSTTNGVETCNVLGVTMTLDTNGGVSGNTSFGAPGGTPFVAALAGSAASSGQYLKIGFNWIEQNRNGVIYREAGTQNLILNTTGLDETGTIQKSFSARLLPQ